MAVSAGAAERAVLLHGPALDLGSIDAALEAEGVRSLHIPDAIEELVLQGAEAPTVVLIDDDVARRDSVDRLAALPSTVVLVAVGTQAEGAVPRDRLFMALPPDPGPDTLLGVLRGAFRHAATRIGAARAAAELERTRGEIQQLNQIGMALMTERDPDQLLVKILDMAMAMTGSDAGSLYLTEEGEEGQERLRFKLAVNASLPDLPFAEFTLPVDRASIAGYAAETGEPVVLDDAYAPPDSAPYSLNRSFDERFGYRTKSMLVVPMADHKGVVVGVLQLINRKRPGAVITDDPRATDHILPYREHELALAQGLAGQAAISIENARLYEQIEHIFESFVKAAVAAIDQRDPTTAGHSVRVAALTTGLAERLPRLSGGRWGGTALTREQMKELRYAALLHDFGKVGVREEVLVKAKKLPPHLWERVQSRFDLIHRTLERDHLREIAAGTHPADRDPDAVAAGLREQLEEVERFREAVRSANEPSVLPEEAAGILEVIASRTFEHVDGESAAYLDPEELAFLSIRKGSLDETERREIESHVTQTFRFLTQIPWTEDLRHVADIAHGHHEKLDGTGYPRQIAGDQIPVQTRIMTIADIFDALTASDRPYKRAMGAERALDILRMEARDGMLDDELVELLIESRVYDEILSKDWREL